MKLWQLYLKRGWIGSIVLAILCILLELVYDAKGNSPLFVAIGCMVWSAPGVIFGWEV